MAPHLKILDDAIVEEVARPNGRLILIGPPRHGKSRLASVYTPTWFLGNNPHGSAILATYSGNFAAGFGGKARDVMRELGPSVFGTGPIGRDAASWWDLAQEGGTMWSAGVGGPIEGKGGGLLVVDDPYETEEEANSPVYREKKWDWMLSTLMNRAEPGATVILMMHRWHEDDMVGRFEELMKTPGADRWRIVRLPALAEDQPAPDDWREPGEALWPWRYPRERLLGIKATIGGYRFDSIWQGTPAPPEGGLVNPAWWNYWTELPEMDEWIQSWDLKFSDKVTPSFVVGGLWGRKGPDKYLVDLRRGHWGFMATLDTMRAFMKKHPMTDEVLVEEKANGAAVIATLRQEISGVIPWDPKGSKPSRARAVVPQIESGNVYLPDPRIPGKEWVEDYLREWRFFPHGAHSDQVDMTSQALLRLKQTERELFV